MTAGSNPTLNVDICEQQQGTFITPSTTPMAEAKAISVAGLFLMQI